MWSHHFMANRRGKSRSSDRFYFLGLQNPYGQWLQPWNWKMLAPWKKRYDKAAGGLSRFSRVWLCIPMNRSTPGSSVHEISQARILAWVAMPSSGGSSWPGIESTSLMSPAFAGKFLTTCHLGSLRWHIKKQTHHFADKGLYSQSYGFSNSHVLCKNWTINKAESWRIDAFELWGWRRLLRVPWTARKTDQSILIGINCEYSLEGLMLKLKLQYFGHLMWRADALEKPWCWERLKAGGEGGGRGWDG